MERSGGWISQSIKCLRIHFGNRIFKRGILNNMNKGHCVLQFANGCEAGDFMDINSRREFMIVYNLMNTIMDRWRILGACRGFGGIRGIRGQVGGRGASGGVGPQASGGERAFESIGGVGGQAKGGGASRGLGP